MPSQYEDKELEAILDKARWGDYQKDDDTWSHGISNRPELLQLITQKQLEALEHDNALTLGHIQSGMPIERLKGVIERRLEKLKKGLQ